MLIIREEQLHLFGQVFTDQFTDRMVPYVKRDFPAQAKQLTEPGIRALIKEVLDLAELHKFESEGAVAALLQLTLMFGLKFRRSPDSAWANALLSNVSVPDPVRMDMIRTRLTANSQGRATVPFTPSAGTA